MRFLEMIKVRLNFRTAPGRGTAFLKRTGHEEEHPADQDLRLGALITILFFLGVALGLYFELLV